MQAIWQYPMADWPGTVTLDMKHGAQMLCVQVHNGTPCVSALLDPAQPPAQVVFHVHNSNEHFPHDEIADDYLGTFQMPTKNDPAISEAFHVFKARPTMSRHEIEEQQIRDAGDFR